MKINRFYILLTLVCLFLQQETIKAQKGANLIPFSVINRSFNKEDIGIRIFIDRILLFETTSINNTFDLKKAHVAYIDPGKHEILIQSWDGTLQYSDSVLVESSTSYHRLWIDYNNIPSERVQFNYHLNQKMKKHMQHPLYNAKDSVVIWQTERNNLYQKKNEILKIETPPGFNFIWGYEIKK